MPDPAAAAADPSEIDGLHSRRSAFLDGFETGSARKLVLLFFAVFFAWFYYRYVPLIPAYQAALAPLLVLIIAAAAARPRTGLLVFTFVFPLVNGLPYFFAIDELIPHAPTALVVFLAFVLGRLIGRVLADPLPPRKACLPPALVLLASWGGLSALITAFRYSDFFPVGASRIFEFKVNAAGLSAGGARMSVVFSALSLLSGIGMFKLFSSAAADKEFMKRLLFVFSLSALLAFLFGIFQYSRSAVPGNTAHWIEIGQINATFKDPNSLAAFLAGGLPLWIALALTRSGPRRLVFVLAAGLGLGILPLSGSRSVVAAAATGGAVFLAGSFFRLGAAGRKKAALAAVGLIVIFLAWNVLAVPDSKLAQRLYWSFDQVLHKSSPGNFFNLRLTQWSAAGRMFKDAPWTGIGMGAYIVEFPDYLKDMNRPLDYTDSALNLPLQIGAELGLLGLILTVAFFGGLARRMGRIIRPVGNEPRDWVELGAAAGLSAFFCNFLFQDYTASYEIQFLFWLLAALVLQAQGAKSPGRMRRDRRMLPLAAAGLVVSGILFLALSWGRFSIPARAEKYGWDQTFGFFSAEKDPQAGDFRWTEKIAGFTVVKEDSVLPLTLRASNPDLGDRPLRVGIYFADKHFRKKALVREVILRDASWLTVPVSLPGQVDETIHLLLDCDRTWNPRRALGVFDIRDLGVAVKGSTTGFENPLRYP